MDYNAVVKKVAGYITSYRNLTVEIEELETQIEIINVKKEDLIYRLQSIRNSERTFEYELKKLTDIDTKKLTEDAVKLSNKKE